LRCSRSGSACFCLRHRGYRRDRPASCLTLHSSVSFLFCIASHRHPHHWHSLHRHSHSHRHLGIFIRIFFASTRFLFIISVSHCSRAFLFSHNIILILPSTCLSASHRALLPAWHRHTLMILVLVFPLLVFFRDADGVGRTGDGDDNDNELCFSCIRPISNQHWHTLISTTIPIDRYLLFLSLSAPTIMSSSQPTSQKQPRRLFFSPSVPSSRRPSLRNPLVSFWAPSHV
jgi:hypothetical protein